MSSVDTNGNDAPGAGGWLRRHGAGSACPAGCGGHAGADSGRLEVVFVAHMPAAAAWSAQSIPVFLEGFDQETLDLEDQVGEALAPTETKWNFQRRNGDIASELLTAGEEQLAGEGPTTKVVLVVGGSKHRIDRFLNSTPTKMIRHDRFEIVVVP